MEFRSALNEALKLCGTRASDPHLLHAALCDVIRDDLRLKSQAADFYRFNKICRLAESMAREPEPRTILTLHERCKEQPDAPEKLCLRWIHTLFVFFYRAGRDGDPEQTERILRSAEADFLEPEQEGLLLPTPQKVQNAQGRKAFRARRVPSPATGQATRGGAARTPRPLPPPTVPKAVQAPIPLIPDKAWVYVAEGSPIIHVSADCPRIRPALGQTVCKGTYERARYKDFLRANHLTKHIWNNFDISKKHCPPICPQCGEFTPILSYRNPKRTYLSL